MFVCKLVLMDFWVCICLNLIQLRVLNKHKYELNTYKYKTISNAKVVQNIKQKNFSRRYVYVVYNTMLINNVMQFNAIIKILATLFKVRLIFNPKHLLLIRTVFFFLLSSKQWHMANYTDECSTDFIVYKKNVMAL